MLVDENSLANTVANLEEEHFFGRVPTAADIASVRRFLSQRLADAYGYRHEMCSPTRVDMAGKPKLFTGDAIGPGAQRKHVLGEEAYRASLILDRLTGETSELTSKCAGHMGQVLDMHYDGRFCCGPCTVAVWRALAAGGYSAQREKLEQGMRFLKSKRDAKGRWGNVPFYYALLVLSEIDRELAADELEVAKRACERLASRSSGAEPFAHRRKELVGRILTR